MSTITYGREANRRSGLRFIPAFVSRVNSIFARSRAERQLEQLDDRLLADIGVKRSDIHKMVWGG